MKILGWIMTKIFELLELGSKNLRGQCSDIKIILDQGGFAEQIPEYSQCLGPMHKDALLIHLDLTWILDNKCLTYYIWSHGGTLQCQNFHIVISSLVTTSGELELIWDLIYFYSSFWASTTIAFEGTPLSMLLSSIGIWW